MTTAIGQRLDRLPITDFHRDLTMRIGVGLLVDGFDVYLAAGVAGALVKQHMATLPQIAMLTALTFVGLGLGGFLAGVAADRFGRRRVLQITLLLVVIGSVGAALSPSVPVLTAWRVFTALGLGGESVLGYAVLSEFLPPARRGRWLAWVGLVAQFGMPLALLAGFFILPHAEGWRWMLAAPGVAALAVLWLRRNVPESPRWLAITGRAEAAGVLVRRIEASAPAGDHAWTPRVPPIGETVRSPAMRLLVGSSINIAVMAAIFGFISWLPTFFASQGETIASSVMFAGLMSIGAPLGVFIGMLVTERIERKWGIVAFSVLAALLGAAYAYAHTTALIIGLGLLVVTVVYLVGALSLSGYVPELFPTSQRMRGVGFCVTVGRIVAIGLPFAIVPLFTRFGQAGVVLLIAAILVVEAAIVAAYGVRTNGRSLDD